MSSWSLRDQFKKVIDQWYLILGFLLLGALLGFGISTISPAPYRAEVDLYVGINITRVNEIEYLIPLAKEEPLNLDDYKNWQLKQLMDLFFSDQVLEDALSLLAEQDPYWQEMTISDFRQGLDIYWYDTGIWRLAYKHDDQRYAVASVQAWLDAGYDYIADLLIFSERVAELDAELEINKKVASNIKAHAVRITTFRKSTSEWLENNPAQDGDTLLVPTQHEELWSLVSADLFETGIWPSLENFPQPGSSLLQYRSWLEETSRQAVIVLNEIEQQLAILEQERNEILPEYHNMLDDSLGLSANVVLRENSAVPVVNQVRDRGTTALAGAGIGLISWLVFTVIRFRGQLENQN
jgi:hypothetical protein